MPLDRLEWLKERQTYLGGTDIAAIAGKGFRTPLEVYLEKIADVVIDDSPSRQALVGQRLEADIVDWAREDFGWEIDPGCTVRDPNYSYLGANTDGMIGADELFEAKTYGMSTKDRWGEPGSAEVPEDYYIQAVWYLGLTGRKLCRFAACDRGTLRLTPYAVPADPATFEVLKRLAIAFWCNNVVTRTPPSLQPGDGENIARLYPTDNGEEITADPALDAAAERIKEIDEITSPLLEEKDALREAIKIKIGPARKLVCSIGSYTLSSRPGNVAWKALAEKLGPTPEQVEEFRARPSRVLTVSYRRNK